MQECRRGSGSGHRSWGSDDALDLQLRLREVEDEPVFPTYSLQVRAHDGEMGWHEFLDRFELHDDLFLYKQVEPMQADSCGDRRTHFGKGCRLTAFAL